MDVVMSIAWNGTHFSGWQSQGPKLTHTIRTVEDAVARALGEAAALGLARPSLTCASRLDAGVHAHSFLVRAHLPGLEGGEGEALATALRARLPVGVHLRALRTAPPSSIFVRRVVAAKQYSYWFRCGDYHAPAGLAVGDFSHFSAFVGDVGGMARATAHFLGSHDMAAFAPSLVRSTRRDGERRAAREVARDEGRDAEGEEDGASTTSSASSSRGTVRTLSEADVSIVSLEEAGAYLTSLGAGAPPTACGRRVPLDSTLGAPGSELLRLRFVGDGFLRHQVRLMAAAVLAVGCGKLSPADIVAALASPSTHHLPIRALPGRGLWLDRSLLREGAGGADDDFESPFWRDPLWCNNPSSHFAADHDVPAGSYHPSHRLPS